MGGWKIALYGTDTYFEPDSNSEVDLAIFETEDPMEDENWLILNIAGMGIKFEQIGETEERIGGFMANYSKNRDLYDIKIFPYKFPDDIDDMLDLKDVLNHKYLYLYKGDYDFDEFSIHNDNKALAIAVVGTIEEEYEKGQKTVSLKVYKIVN